MELPVLPVRVPSTLSHEDGDSGMRGAVGTRRVKVFTEEKTEETR